MRLMEETPRPKVERMNEQPYDHNMQMAHAWIMVLIARRNRNQQTMLNDSKHGGLSTTSTSQLLSTISPFQELTGQTHHRKSSLRRVSSTGSQMNHRETPTRQRQRQRQKSMPLSHSLHRHLGAPLCKTPNNVDQIAYPLYSPEKETSRWDTSPRSHQSCLSRRVPQAIMVPNLDLISFWDDEPRQREDDVASDISIDSDILDTEDYDFQPRYRTAKVSSHLRNIKRGSDHVIRSGDIRQKTDVFTECSSEAQFINAVHSKNLERHEEPKPGVLSTSTNTSPSEETSSYLQHEHTASLLYPPLSKHHKIEHDATWGITTATLDDSCSNDLVYSAKIEPWPSDEEHSPFKAKPSQRSDAAICSVHEKIRARDTNVCTRLNNDTKTEETATDISTRLQFWSLGSVHELNLTSVCNNDVEPSARTEEDCSSDSSYPPASSEKIQVEEAIKESESPACTWHEQELLVTRPSESPLKEIRGSLVYI